MKTSKKLKIWTLATHAFILVGFGHGILFFFFIEILWFPFVTKNNLSLIFNSSFESRLPIIGLTTLLGQISILISVLNDNKKIKLLGQIAGLTLLWLSIIYFTWTLERDSDVHFATITAFPFCICTIATFVGQPIQKTVKKIYQRAVDNY